MRTVRLLIFLFLTGFACVTSAAISCVQNRGSATFTAVNQKTSQKPDCVLPEKLNRTMVAETSSAVQAETAPPVQSFATVSESQLPWELRVEDGSVYAALKRWSSQVGWQVSWEIPVDFPIEIVDVSMGSFEDSVRRVLTAFKVSDYPPHPCFHQNKVIRVVRRIQGNDDECR